MSDRKGDTQETPYARRKTSEGENSDEAGEQE